MCLVFLSKGIIKHQRFTLSHTFYAAYWQFFSGQLTIYLLMLTKWFFVTRAITSNSSNIVWILQNWVCGYTSWSQFSTLVVKKPIKKLDKMIETCDLEMERLRVKARLEIGEKEELIPKYCQELRDAVKGMLSKWKAWLKR